MSERSIELTRVLQEREAALADIEYGRRIAKLMQDPDFKELILGDYMVKEAARFVQISGDPVFDKAKREDALNMAQATGHFKRWLQVTQTRATDFKHALEEMDALIEELRAQPDEE